MSPAPILSVDIDGTIANVSKRLKKAEKADPSRGHKFWKIFLDGDNYHLDQPIKPALEFLKDFVKEHPEDKIVYLSGRPKDTTPATKKWLDKYGYPQGEILLRPYGRTETFKAQELEKLKKEGHQIIAHIGDTADDENAAKAAGVKFIKVPTNGWNTQDVRKALSNKKD